MLEFDAAQRACEVLLALAFLQHSAEHLWRAPDHRPLFLPRVLLSGALMLGVSPAWVLAALAAHSLLVLHRFQGPYNGGSDKMTLLILYCLGLSHWIPGAIGPLVAMGYLGLQLTLSYVISGQVKLANADWRSGRALRDVFAFSAYPVSQSLRGLADQPRLMWAASWAVMLFEVLFPLALLHPVALVIALGIGFAFHVANALLFGLNRFVWAWLAAYPSILWLQGQLPSPFGP